MQSLIASKISSFQNVLRIGHLNKRLMVNVAKNKKSLEEIIKIPKAIPRFERFICKSNQIILISVCRGPTDILKALSSTIEQDNTGPSYQYIDDPYLTPVNNVDKVFELIFMNIV